MDFSKLFLPLLYLLPLLHASNPKKCSSSFSKPLRCGPLEVPIRFPFCDHPGFNLHCNDLNQTVLELPMSGTFLVREIHYELRQIYLNDPENCLAKRLLNFNLSRSLFSPHIEILYTLLVCPKEITRWSPSIPCLNNSTSSFFATSTLSLIEAMVPSCQIVKTLHVPVTWPFQDSKKFSTYLNNQSILLQWDLPDSESSKTGYLSNKAIILIISFSIVGGVIFFNIMLAWIGCCLYNTRSSDSSGQWNADNTIAATSTLQPRRTMVTRGLDQSTIESYKKVELGESKRISGTNGIVCPICLSEYASKETVRFIPECNHCFHVECIDPWLKIHGSCPLCRNSHA